MEDYEYIIPDTLEIEYSMFWVDLTIAVVTNIACLFLVPVQIFWWLRFRKSGDLISHHFLIAAFIKSAIWYMTFTQIKMMVVLDLMLTGNQMVTRILFMVGVLLHSLMALRFIFGWRLPRYR